MTAETVGAVTRGEVMRRTREKAAGRPAQGGRRADLALLGAVLALLVVGLNMVYSASFVVARDNPSFGSDVYFLMRQLTWAALGGAALALTAWVDYRRWRPLAAPLLGLTALLLLAVLFSNLGRTAYGAQRWLALEPLPAVQPSELAKLALVLYCADRLAHRQGRLHRLDLGFLFLALVLLGVAGLIMAQPDFGTSLVVVATVAGLLFLAGARLPHLAGGIAIGGAALASLATSAGYRAQRLAAFFHSSEDPLGIGWHTSQASIALGSGGLVGLGLGASRQKFYYLYGAHTDSIFAVIGEELGLIGTLAVLALFVLVAYRGCLIALRAPDTFGMLLAAGITFWITFQALTNIAVVTSTVPFTGIPLPFVSFGGSSLVVSLAAVGLLLNISRAQSEPGSRPHEAPRATPGLRRRTVGAPGRRPAGERLG